MIAENPPLRALSHFWLTKIKIVKRKKSQNNK